MEEKASITQNLLKTCRSRIHGHSGNIPGKLLKKESTQSCQEPEILSDAISPLKECGIEKDTGIMRYMS